MRPVFLILALLCACACAADKGIVFCTYNIRNWVGDDQLSTKGTPAKPKSEEEKEAVLRVIRDIQPDIIGICEMGSPAQFEDFLARVKPLGLEHAEYVDGADPDRHLALVSRFPIAARDSQTDLRFMMSGVEQIMRRGILDVTIQITPDYQLRCVGVHLKSKLPSAIGEALVRRHEAAKLRTHLDAILKATPTANLLCYGDFNDARNEATFHEITGSRESVGYLDDIPAKDELGDRWTHYWREADAYSRIDYLLVSKGLAREVQKDSGRVNRSPSWNQASDHRAVSVTILPVNR